MPDTNRPWFPRQARRGIGCIPAPYPRDYRISRRSPQWRGDLIRQRKCRTVDDRRSSPRSHRHTHKTRTVREGKGDGPQVAFAVDYLISPSFSRKGYFRGMVGPSAAGCLRFGRYPKKHWSDRILRNGKNVCQAPLPGCPSHLFDYKALRLRPRDAAYFSIVSILIFR
jgi:hypothetical protein